MNRLTLVALVLTGLPGAGGLGCAANSAQLGPLEAEVRRLRTEQEHQAQQIELLQSRLVLTEDAARQARNAVLNARGRSTIHLGAEPGPTDGIQVDATGTAEDPGSEQPATGSPQELPRVRISGGEHIPERPPFVVREADRLPVVPIAPPPTSSTTGTPGSVPGGSSPGGRPPSGIPVPGPGVSPQGRSAPGGRGEHAPLLLTPGAGPPVAVGAGTLDPRAAQAYDAGLVLARQGHCGGPDGALEAFAAFLVHWPDHPHADNAMYWRGECLAHDGDFHRAVTEWEGLLARFPVGNKVPDALYKLAVTYRRLGDAAAADRAAQRLMNEHPDSDAARRMRAERQRP